MKELDKRLIQALRRNDYKAAKGYAKEKLMTDTAKKDDRFCKAMLQEFEQAELTQLEVPANIRGLLVMEDVQETFNHDRYYLSAREQNLTERILGLNKAADKLASLGIRFVNSTMLWGESGTGKTSYGRYLAHRLDRPFAYMTFSRLIESLLGGTQKNINKVFDFIKGEKCVFMIDEIDAIAQKRGANGDSGEMSRVVISLMQNLDELQNDVVLLGATNRVDIIDAAVLRRFSLIHEVKRLECVEREKMAMKFFGDIEDYEVPENIVMELAALDDTQAGLTNRMIMKLVNEFSDEQLLDNGQMELFV